MRRSVAKLAVLLPFLLSLTSCSKPAKEKTLIIVGNTVLDGVSTTEGDNLFSNGLEGLIFSSLVIGKSEDQYKELLLDRAAPLEDGRVWDIYIKEGVRFHDGAPLTADDVVFSIDKSREFSERLNAVKKAAALDGKRIRLTLDNPCRDISVILASILVYPRGILRDGKNWRESLLKKPVGSGPFIFVKWIKNGMELKANADYFEGRPRIDRLIYRYEKDDREQMTSLLHGDADILKSISPETARFLEKDDKYSVNEFVNSYFTAVFLNNESPLFKDREVRRAVSMAIDRDAIIEKALKGGGKAAYGPFTADMLPKGYDASPVRYDPKKAAELLNQAGWIDKGGDGVLEKNGGRFRVVLYYSSNNDSFRLAADMVSRYLFEIGIEVEGIPVTNNDLLDRRFPERYDAILIEVTPYSPDTIWSERFYKNRNGLNLSNYRSSRTESLLAKLNGAASSEETMERRSKLDRLIRDDSPAIFLYNLIDYSAASRRVINGDKFYNTPYSLYMLKDVDIKE